MLNHTLHAGEFKLMLSLRIFESDIQYSPNTILAVSVVNDKFSSFSEMDIDIKQFAAFSIHLKSLYNNLEGTAKIEEPYGFHKYISFSSDNKGQIIVKGYLCDVCDDLIEYKVNFSSVFNQTYLKQFADELYASYSKYAK